MTGVGSCVSPLSDVGPPVEQLPPGRSQSRQQAHQGNGPRGNPLLCYAFTSVKPKLTRKWVHRSLAVIPGGGLQDQKRTEKVTKRVNAIQEVKESVALLTQLLQDYDSAAASQSNGELIQVTRKAGSGVRIGERRRKRPFVPVFAGAVPALREDETDAVQTGERHRGQRRGSR